MDLHLATIFLWVLGLPLAMPTYLESILGYYKDPLEYKENYIEETPIHTFLAVEKYDFIIIGAGTAGCAIASRLSEVTSWNILLLEAGHDEHFLSEVPASTEFLQSTEIDWHYSTQPQTNACLSMTGKRCSLPRGKIVGGSSSMNYMIYSRGNKQDYDQWENLGNTGWAYQDVLPYFLKSENMLIPKLRSSSYHGTGGYIKVDTVPYRTGLANSYLEAGAESGFDITDPNGDTQLGFSFLQSNIHEGSRYSSSKAFLRPVQRRKNLHIVLNARVLNIDIDPESKKAQSVVFMKTNKQYTARVRKEVILSAGTLNSPQILMLSGVGPRDHLQDLNITVVADLQVGSNFQDHVRFLGLTFLVNQSLPLLDGRLSDPLAALEYVFQGKGPLTVAGGIEAIAYLKTSNATENRVPDINLFFVSQTMNTAEGRKIANNLRISNAVYSAMYEPILNQHSWTTWPVILHPKSRGYVRLNSPDPLDALLVHANYLTESEDVDMLVKGIKMAVKLSGTKEFKKHFTKIHTVLVPGCEGNDFGTDGYWRCAVQHLSSPMHNQVGTCKMAADGVVDRDLRVYGVKGLRVADASVIPVLPSAGTNAAVHMIAEKASDIIKLNWRARN